MPKKRESRQKSRQSVAIRGEKKRAKGDRDTDRDTLRRVREWAEQLLNHTPSAGDCGAWYMGLQRAAGDVLSILNGTERKGKHDN